MARKARIQKTALPPKTRKVHDEEGDVNEGETEAGADIIHNVDSANDGEVLHLGSDLPDAPDSSEDEQTSEAEAVERQQTTGMGANNSREELNAALHATAAELRNRTGAVSVVEKRSTGKLKRPSNGATNPAYRNPLPTTASSQRRLPPSSKIRASTYDIDGESPVKWSPAKSRLAAQDSGFSPRRSERRAAQQASEQLSNEADVDAPAEPEQDVRSPRRSKRIQEADHEDGQDAIYRDYFKDSTVRQYQDAEVEAGAEVEAEAEGDTAMVAGVGGDEVDKSPEQPVRPRGRPKKSAEHEPAEEQPAEEKRRPGRPRKTGDGVQQTDHSLRNRDEGRSVPEDDGASRQTKAQTSISASPQKERPMPRQKENSNRAQRNINRQKRSNAQRQADDDAAYDPDAEGVGLDAGPASSEDGLFVPQEAVIVHPSEMNLSNGGGEPGEERSGGDRSGEDEDFDEEAGSEEGNEHQPPISGLQKRKASRQAQGSSSKIKRRKFTIIESQVEEVLTGLEDQNSKRRVYEQWPQLLQIFRNLDQIGISVIGKGKLKKHKKHTKPDLEDNDVKAVLELCAKAGECFTALKDHPDDVENARDSLSALDEIKNRVDGLGEENEKFPIENETKISSICFHLVPGLVELLRRVVECYEAMDKDRTTDGQITISHLGKVNEIVCLVLDLVDSTKNYVPPKEGGPVLRPVRSGIAAPLQSVRDAFNYHIYVHESAARDRKQREATARDRAHRLEQEERQSRQQARIRRLRDKWSRLHEERMWAEGGIPSRKKREYLQLPNQVDIDENGMLFERVEIFHPRVGPPPGLVDAAAKQEWSTVELSDLCEGLKRYSGPNVFERIIRKYCGQRQALNKYNVTEIVTTAAQLRQLLIRDQGEKYEDVEAWIMAIPVWTKGHQALGKENEDGALVDPTAE